MANRVHGKGTVTASSESSRVTYDLVFFRDQLKTTALGSGYSSIPSGVERIRGRVLPVCFGLGENLTLEMEDGRKLSFFYTDSGGAISFSGWIE
jgi:hypothetical protein